MLLQVSQFCQRVEGSLNDLVDELQSSTGRYGESEAEAWRRSLRKLSRVLVHSRLSDFHLHLGTPGTMEVEYRLPASSAWCDAVLLGASLSNPMAVMIELKDWSTDGDRPGPRPGLIQHQGTDRLHPSEQVRGYVEYCRYFHSAVVEQSADVAGCVYFTRGADVSAYMAAPHSKLVAEYPVFGDSSNEVVDHLPVWLANRLALPAPDFAEAFDKGVYRQNRSFVLQMARTIMAPAQTEFVLLDAQREGYELCLQAIDELLADWRSEDKAVVVIEGPPGSGKSVLAAHLWAALIEDERIDGDVVLTTTSGSQRSNWTHLFSKAARGPGGRGVVMPANGYNPGMSPKWVAERRSEGYSVEIESWEDNIKLLRDAGQPLRMADNALSVSIVDEAHALIDPTLAGKRGIAPSGWAMHAGAQAWNIMRASRLSIFLMDAAQSYRDNETTSRAQIERWAAHHDIEQVRFVSLGDAQFRCGGSKEYVDWVEQLLDRGAATPTPRGWRRRVAGDGGAFGFEIAEDPAELEARLREQLEHGATARLLASYGRRWLTKASYRPHELPPEKMDFHIPYQRRGRTLYWSRPWNFAPSQDYALFVQAPEGSRMHEDPLCEVGCPYVVRGFDYDWVGLLWLGDLVRRGDAWQVNLESVHESAWNKTLAAAKRERAAGETGPGTQELLERLKRGYRILLTRAIRGVFVWFEDEETRAYVEQMLAAEGK